MLSLRRCRLLPFLQPLLLLRMLLFHLLGLLLMALLHVLLSAFIRILSFELLMVLFLAVGVFGDPCLAARTAFPAVSDISGPASSFQYLEAPSARAAAGPSHAPHHPDAVYCFPPVFPRPAFPRLTFPRPSLWILPASRACTTPRSLNAPGLGVAAIGGLPRFTDARNFDWIAPPAHAAFGRGPAGGAVRELPVPLPVEDDH